MLNSRIRKNRVTNIELTDNPMNSPETQFKTYMCLHTYKCCACHEYTFATNCINHYVVSERHISSNCISNILGHGVFSTDILVLDIPPIGDDVVAGGKSEPRLLGLVLCSAVE